MSNPECRMEALELDSIPLAVHKSLTLASSRHILLQSAKWLREFRFRYNTGHKPRTEIFHMPLNHKPELNAFSIRQRSVVDFIATTFRFSEAYGVSNLRRHIVDSAASGERINST